MSKSSDNVIDLNERRKRDQSITFRQRVGRWVKLTAVGVLVLIIALLIGGYVLSQGVKLNDAHQWLEEMNTVLMLWRLILYGGAVLMCPRLFLTPDQQASTSTVRRARWIIVAVAVMVEILLVQKGLAGLVSVLQGGF